MIACFYDFFCFIPECRPVFRLLTLPRILPGRGEFIVSIIHLCLPSGLMTCSSSTCHTLPAFPETSDSQNLVKFVQ